MLSPLLVGRLRQIGVWQLAQRVHRLVVPPLCGAVHAAVGLVGPAYVPLDIILKHHYDYVPVQIDPRAVAGLVPIRAGIGYPTGGLRGFSSRYRRWIELGGGWKNVEQHLTRNFAGRFIADGDWDTKRLPFEAVSSVVEIFVDGVPPQETEEYKKILARIENNDLVWTRGFQSERDLDSYFAELMAVYDDIRTNGFRTQAELGLSGADEIRVCIGRDGEFSVFGGGTHRLSIALVLQLDRIPVLVKRVHARWASACVERYGEPVESAIAKGIEDLTRSFSPNGLSEGVPIGESELDRKGSSFGTDRHSC